MICVTEYLSCLILDTILAISILWLLSFQIMIIRWNLFSIYYRKDYGISLISTVTIFFSTSNPLPNNSIFNSHPTPSPSFFIIPYISNLSDKISMIFRDLNRSPAFVIHNKLNIFIKLHKDNLSKFKDVVYKLNCIDCNASYVGQTSKQLHTRLKKHKANQCSYWFVISCLYT